MQHFFFYRQIKQTYELLRANLDIHDLKGGVNANTNQLFAFLSCSEYKVYKQEHANPKTGLSEA